MAHYLDTSALVKLVVAEAETSALRAWMLEQPSAMISSDLTRTELTRAVRRAAPDRAVQARAVLDSITLMSLSTATFEAAAHVEPTLLRSLDALHLAMALELGDDLDGLVTYDDRQAEAAGAHGITVLAPR